jgi:hypothetical protein
MGIIVALAVVVPIGWTIVTVQLHLRAGNQSK